MMISQRGKESAATAGIGEAAAIPGAWDAEELAAASCPVELDPGEGASGREGALGILLPPEMPGVEGDGEGVRAVGDERGGEEEGLAAADGVLAVEDPNDTEGEREGARVGLSAGDIVPEDVGFKGEVVGLAASDRVLAAEDPNETEGVREDARVGL